MGSTGIDRKCKAYASMSGGECTSVINALKIVIGESNYAMAA